jgi:hypothetical protein
VGAIITNPPYMLATDFAHHALQLAPRVYMLLPLQFIEGGRRDRRRDQILDGGRLAKLLPFRERLPMMHRHGWEGKKAGSSQVYAWFVWDREYSGPIISTKFHGKGLAPGRQKQKPRERPISSRLVRCVCRFGQEP